MICQNIEYVYRAFDSQVIIEMVNIDVYSTQLANQIASDLANNPLAKGEQLNLIDYSGGGQVVLNAAEKLNGIATINNTVLIGAPIEEIFNNTGNVTVICSACDPSSWTFGWGFDSEFAGWVWAY